MVVTKMLDSVSQRLPPNDSRKMAIGFAVNGSQNPSLEVNGPAFIQPEMLPRGIGNQVTTPAVS